MIQLGIENLLKNKKLTKQLLGKRVALVAHPASVDKNLVHSIDLLSKNLKGGLSCAFGPQHGMRGEKQDNMIESDDFIDPIHKIPIFSLYGTVRRPTPKMLDHFDIALFDLQDVGCRIYTFLTTLFY
ncbi:MAG: exo-beta-N-acetylmuramidase NamZ domain-containing protein, partial [Bdellovibrionota bacterium]